MKRHIGDKWHVGGEVPGECIIDVTWIDSNGEPQTVAEVRNFDGFEPGEHGEANAKLIAAAPALLAACEAIYAIGDQLIPTDGPLFVRASIAEKLLQLRAAIAAATT